MQPDSMDLDEVVVVVVVVPTCMYSYLLGYVLLCRYVCGVIDVEERNIRPGGFTLYLYIYIYM